MAADDDPFDAKGRTVIRPVSGRGRPAGPSRTVIDPGVGQPREAAPRESTVFDSGNRTAAAPAVTGTVVQEAFAPDLVQGSAKTGEPPAGTPSGKPPAPSNNATQDDLADAAEAVRYPSANPLMAAAAPLLMLLANLRAVPIDVHASALNERVAGLIQAFGERIARSTVVSEADARIATFALCETADDIVPALPGIDRPEWLRHGMLQQFFRTAVTGIGFFEALNKVLSNPEAHQDLLELMHACLSLGFEGQYRGAGQAEGLERVRRDVYDSLRYFKARPEAFSVHWKPSSAAVARRRAKLPLWAIAAAACALVTGAFFGMRSLITDQGEALAAALLDLGPQGPVTIQRASFVPFTEEVKPPPVTQQRIDRIDAALAREIASGGVTVEIKGDFIVMEINNRLLFDSGKAEVKPEFDPVAASIAGALDKEKGAIRVVGHTDNVKPKKSGAFKSNYDLSVARAAAVEKVIAPKLADASRVTVEGKGEDEPIADNASPEGRARNRRVDILIAAEDAS